MNANNDWEKAKQAVDDAMGAVYDALHHLNEKVDELMQTPVVDEKKDEVCRKARRPSRTSAPLWSNSARS